MYFLKNVFFAFLFCFSFLGSSQELQTSEFGKPTESDFSLQVYEKDSTAAAVVLYERGYYHFETVGNSVKLIKDVYKKIKVFDSKRFDGATVEVPLLVFDETSEKIKGYRALTHNRNLKSAV